MSDPAPIKRNDRNEHISLVRQVISLLGQLRHNDDVVTPISDRRLESTTETGIIKSHRYTRRITLWELSLNQTLPTLQELVEMDLGTTSIDLGVLAISFEEEDGDLRVSLERELTNVTGAGIQTLKTGTVLYGLGRIGRLLARIPLAREALFNGLRLRAIVVRQNGEDDIVKCASLLHRDSAHGVLNDTISVGRENNIIWANGTPIQVIYPSGLVTVDYTAYDISGVIVTNNTGRWRDHEGLSQYLQSKGVARALLIAPGKGDAKSIVYGINRNIIEDSNNILSAASCTTNGTASVPKVINDKWGVEFGHIETVHSLTSDQDLIDNSHRGSRRSRAATLNVVLTETGATKAVAKALPEFEDELTGNAIHIPTPDVPMVVLNLVLDTEVDRGEINNYLHEVSLKFVLRQQIGHIHSPGVISTDFVGSIHAGIVDGPAIIANGKHLVLYVRYDNEFGYSSQVIHIAEETAGAHPRVYPKRKRIDELQA